MQEMARRGRRPARWRAAGERLALLALLVGSALAGRPLPASACDICAVYTAVELGRGRVGFRLGMAEQYSNFRTLKEGTDTVPNPGEKLDSSITQAFVGYNFNPTIGVQLNLPIIYRSYRRLEEGGLRSGSESGIGDLSLLGQWVAFDAVGERGLMRFTLFGGLKFPTGDPDRLKEETEEEHDHEVVDPDDLFPPGFGSRSQLGSVAHGESGSGIHGHDLALGSGSVDGIVGGEIYLNHDRFFWTTSAQYAIRTEGSFDYQYANDLTWIGGPGYYPYLADDMTLGVQAVLSGETKGNDELDGEKLDDTGLTALYLGPAIRYSWATSLAAEVMADLPVLQNVTSLQIVPDYRIRAGLVWRF
jgi:hypothetical protein